MLSDIPYTDITHTGCKYDVWLLRDVYDNTFADIAAEYGVSMTTVVNDYNSILYMKMVHYVNHLSIVYGQEDTVYFQEIWNRAYDCYRSTKYVVAYFEKEYADILSEYRNGEPGVSQRILRDLPPLRKRISKRTIHNIVDLRETNGMTYDTIAKKLHITKEKAEELYNHYYHDLYIQLSDKLIAITGDINLRRRYQNGFKAGCGKKKYDCLVNDYPVLCKSILDIKKRA